MSDGGPLRRNMALAAADPERWKIEANDSGGRAARYTGCGRRGGQSAAARDDRDLAVALDEITAGREQLAAAHALSGWAARRAAVAAALAKIALGVRFCDDLILRHGGQCPDMGAPVE